MRFLAKYAGTNTAYTKGAKYQITVEDRFFGRSVKVTPFKRTSRFIRHGEPVQYDDLSAFLYDWQVIENLTHEERAAFEELHNDTHGVGLFL